MPGDIGKDPKSAHRDRVSQVYFGMLEWGTTGEILRQRIDWMVDQVQGSRILDVGCSEGVLEILLARKGFNVTGVDVNAEALLFARELLSREPPEVRSRAHFIHSDLAQSHLPEHSFDTVVLGEVLEHLDKPETLLDRCLNFIRPEGRLIITTPFGYHPHTDHHQTFCLSNFIELLQSRCALQNIQIDDGYIRMVGHHLSSTRNSWEQLNHDRVLSLTEDALLSIQRQMYTNLSKHNDRAKLLHKNVTKERNKADQLQQALETEKNKAKKIEKDFNLSKNRADTLQNTLQLQKYKAAQLKQSTTYQIGNILVSGMLNPSTLWRTPFRLLHLYRATRSKIDTPKHPSHPEGKVKQLDIPKFTSPPPQTDDKPVVAAILDTFTEHCMRYEADLFLLSAQHCVEEMQSLRPVCLLVESAWSGNSGQWRNLITNFQDTDDNPLRTLLDYCRHNNIPTMFWNKEDPPNFDHFIDAAREFDFVFTTAAECIPMYKSVCGHDRIYVTPFASQPRLHNPCKESSWPRHFVCFAGSWREKYPERNQALVHLLDSALPFGLHIFDRNLARTDRQRRGLHFPARYQKAIVGSLDYDRMLTAYRCYDVMLNANSVTESPTMFSRRVFECLGCGTPVISNDSAGVREMLGGRVRIARNSGEASTHLRELFVDEDLRRREGHLGYRFVHENHTYRRRLNEMFVKIGVEAKETKSPAVSVFLVARSLQNLTLTLKNYTQQRYRNKELLVLVAGAELLEEKTVEAQTECGEDVKVLWMQDKETLGQALNRGVMEVSGDYIAMMEDGDVYGEHYLSDMMIAAHFSEADILGKGMFFVYFTQRDMLGLSTVTAEHQFTQTVQENTLIARRAMLCHIPFSERTEVVGSALLADARQAKCRIYSADVFNYVKVLNSAPDGHKGRIDNTDCFNNCRCLQRGMDLQRVMI